MLESSSSQSSVTPQCVKYKFLKRWSRAWMGQQSTYIEICFFFGIYIEFLLKSTFLWFNEIKMVHRVIYYTEKWIKSQFHIFLKFFIRFFAVPYYYEILTQLIWNYQISIFSHIKKNVLGVELNKKFESHTSE